MNQQITVLKKSSYVFNSVHLFFLLYFCRVD